MESGATGTGSNDCDVEEDDARSGSGNADAVDDVTADVTADVTTDLTDGVTDGVKYDDTGEVADDFMDDVMDTDNADHDTTCDAGGDESDESESGPRVASTDYASAVALSDALDEA